MDMVVFNWNQATMRIESISENSVEDSIYEILLLLSLAIGPD